MKTDYYEYIGCTFYKAELDCRNVNHLKDSKFIINYEKITDIKVKDSNLIDLYINGEKKFTNKNHSFLANFFDTRIGFANAGVAFDGSKLGFGFDASKDVFYLIGMLDKNGKCKYPIYYENGKSVYTEDENIFKEILIEKAFNCYNEDYLYIKKELDELNDLIKKRENDLKKVQKFLED